MLRRPDLPAATEALSRVGFAYRHVAYRHVAGIDAFLDGPDARARDAIHVVFAGEKVRPEYSHVAPDPASAEATPVARILSLDALVQMKLTSYRDKDRVHLRDLIGVGLVVGGRIDGQGLGDRVRAVSAIA